MRTSDYQSILLWIARKMLGAVEIMQDEDAAAYTDGINTALRDCWERDAWPEWTVTEERWFRAFWDVGTTYAAGDEVYYAPTCAYWRSLVDNQFANVPGENGFWEQCGVCGALPLDPYISLDQPGKTPIGTIFRISPQNPDLYPGSKRLRYTFSNNGVQVPALSVTSVWMTFRLRPPVFTSNVWSSTTAYAAGDRVYYPASKECWLAGAASTNVAPGTNAAKWQVIGFPYVLAEVVKKFAYAAALEDDGQQDKAGITSEAAEEMLATEWNKADSQQNQVRRAAVEVRGAHDSSYPRLSSNYV